MAFLVDNIVPITLRIDDVIVFGGAVVSWYNKTTGVITCGAIIPCNEVIKCL